MRAGVEPTGFVELLLPARPGYVRLARTILAAVAAHAGFSSEQTADMAVAVCEAFTNVVLHARTPWVTLRYATDGQALTIEVEDDGPGFDPAIFDRPFAPQSGRGRGVHLIRSLMDAVECRSGPAGTVVRMVRMRVPAGRAVRPDAPPARPVRTMAHLGRAIERYQRDLALMQGEIEPGPGNLDDLAILERYRAAADKDGLISDYKLRIKTLQATLEILREEARGDPLP